MLTLGKSKKLVVLLILDKLKIKSTKLFWKKLDAWAFFFFECLGIQFFNSLPFLTQSVRLPLVTYPSLCSTYATYGTLCHAIGHQVLPTQPLPREAKDFPRGDNHSKHNPLLTYLAWLQPIYFNLKFVFIRVNTAKVLLVVKTLIKNIEQQPH